MKNREPAVRTYRPMTDEEYEAETAKNKHFKKVVANYEYEEVLGELWDFA